ncbi:hypothetical protein QWJ46_28570 [Rhizobium sp. CBN3]|uniref:hypothetical protein n=1 Tax=Rhizobium sp. CBN3 TaxID=3058045 RepID=UPI002671464F|nr:hypothetical protein [Rhizobium sp. CBN3]MDO3436595.1 hypothetical protein [Rhizobium sp. CBN3]
MLYFFDNFAAVQSFLAGSGTLRPAIGLQAPFAWSVIADTETGRHSSGKTVLAF